MRNSYGLPLDGGLSWRKALREYILNPTDTTWDELAHKIVPDSGGRTMWQAWLLVDSTAPRSLKACGMGECPIPEENWQGRIPSVFTLKHMIESVQDTRMNQTEFESLLDCAVRRRSKK